MRLDMSEKLASRVKRAEEFIIYSFSLYLQAVKQVVSLISSGPV